MLASLTILARFAHTRFAHSTNLTHPFLLSPPGAGPCSTDGQLNFSPGKCVESKKGIYTYPTCSIRGAESSPNSGKCLDVEGERMDPGGDLLLYPCTGRWNQYFSFGGDQIENTDCNIYLNIPSHLVKSKVGAGKNQTNHLFLGGKEIKGNAWLQPLKTKDCLDGKTKCSDWDEWLIVPLVVDEDEQGGEEKKKNARDWFKFSKAKVSKDDL